MPQETDPNVRPELDPTQPETSLERQQAWDKAHGYNPNAPENQPAPEAAGTEPAPGEPPPGAKWVPGSWQPATEPGQDQPH